MSDKLPNCWEIEKCGREKGGDKEKELGECLVCKEKMGHSCWAVAGTLCGGLAQGTVAQKIGYCTSCEVHKLYNRSTGEKGEQVAKKYSEEDKKYIKIMLKKSGVI